MKVQGKSVLVDKKTSPKPIEMLSSFCFAIFAHQYQTMCIVPMQMGLTVMPFPPQRIMRIGSQWGEHGMSMFGTYMNQQSQLLGKTMTVKFLK